MNFRVAANRQQPKPSSALGALAAMKRITAALSAKTKAVRWSDADPRLECGLWGSVNAWLKIALARVRLATFNRCPELAAHVRTL